MGDEVKWVKVPVVAIAHVTAYPVNATNGSKGLGECACETRRRARTYMAQSPLSLRLELPLWARMWKKSKHNTRVRRRVVCTRYHRCATLFGIGLRS